MGEIMSQKTVINCRESISDILSVRQRLKNWILMLILLAIASIFTIFNASSVLAESTSLNLTAWPDSSYKQKIITKIRVGDSIDKERWEWRHPFPRSNTFNDIICPSANICYIVEDLGAIFKTSDGGNTWYMQKSDVNLALNQISCPAINTCFVVGNGGTILSTTDGGDSWLDKNTQLTNDDLEGINCTSIDTCLVVGKNNIALKTTDQGESWESLPLNSTEHFYDVTCNGIDNCIAVGENGQIRLSNDGGTTWHTRTVEATARLNSITCASPSSCLIGGQSGTLLKTVDGGETWSIDKVGDSNIYDVECNSNAECIVVGSTRNVYISNDTGNTWETKNIDIPRAISSIDCRTDTCLAVGIGGAILKSTDRGNTWELESEIQTDLDSIDCLSSTTCFAIGDSKAIYGTKNGGTTWNIIAQPTGDYLLYDITCVFGESLCVIIASSGYVVRTVNGGNNWTVSFSGSGWSGTPTAIECITTTTCLATGGQGTIFISYNQGVKWDLIHAPNAKIFNDITCPSSLICYIVGDSGIILKSVNQGDNWQELISGTNQDIVDISCPNDANCFVVGDGRTLLASHDGGATWQRQYENTTHASPHLRDIHCLSIVKCLVAGTHGGILSTEDGGSVWVEQESGTYNHLYGVYCSDSIGHCFVLGDYGTILTKNITADVNFEQTASTLTAQPNETVVYTSVARSLVKTIMADITYDLPPTLINIANIIGDATYNEETHSIHSSSEFIPGIDKTITYQATISPESERGSTIINTATLTWDNGEVSSHAAVNIPGIQTAVLIYGVGDNDLENDIYRLINKAERSGSSANRTVYVLVDGKGDNNTYIYRLKHDLFFNCPNAHKDPGCRGRYVEGVDYWTHTDDTATPSSLADFIEHSIDDFTQLKGGKPEQLLLSIVGHGNGWSPAVRPAQPARYRHQPGGPEIEDSLGGLIWDDTQQHSLSTKALGVGLREAVAAIGQQIDLLYMDACSMGMLEIAYEVKDSVRYMLASENTTWASFSYDQLLHAIDGSKDAMAIGQAWLDIESDVFIRAGGHPFTLSLIDLAQLGDVRERLDALADALIVNVSTNKAQILQALNATECFESVYDGNISAEDSYCDLKSFASALKSEFSGSSGMVSAVNDLLAALEIAVIAERHGSGKPWLYEDANWHWENIGGIAVDIPLRLESDARKRAFYTDAHLQIAEDGRWDDFIAEYWNNSLARTARTSALSEALPTCEDTKSCEGLGQSLDMKPEIAAIGGQEVTTGETFTMTVDFISNNNQVSEAHFTVALDEACLARAHSKDIIIADLDGFETTITFDDTKLEFAIVSTASPPVQLPDTNVAIIPLKATCAPIADTAYKVDIQESTVTFRQPDGKTLPSMITDGMVTVLNSGPMSDVTMALSPENLSAISGETIEVEVEVHADDALVDVAVAYINFDPTHLQVTEVTPLTLPNSTLTPKYDNDMGEISLGFIAFEEDKTGSFKLGKVTFEVIVDGAYTTTLSFNKTNPKLSDVVLQGRSLLADTVDTTVAIQPASEPPIQPTVPTTVTATLNFVDRLPPPHIDLQQPFTLTLFSVEEEDTESMIVHTDENATFTVGNLFTGTYNILLESLKTVAITVPNVTLVSGINMLDLGDVEDRDGILQGYVKFGLADAASPLKLSRPITISLAGELNAVMVQTTNAEGGFEISDLPVGDYTITVWSRRMAKKSVDVTIKPAEITEVDFGRLRTGDADGDGMITINDFSTFLHRLGTCRTTNDTFDDRGDFNEDDCIQATDLSLWLASFRAQYGLPVRLLVSASANNAISSLAAPLQSESDMSVNLLMSPEKVSVRSGDIFSVTFMIDAGVQPLDAAAVYLDYDSDDLKAVSIERGTAFNMTFLDQIDLSGQVNYAAGMMSTGSSTDPFMLFSVTFEALTDLTDEPFVTLSYDLPRKTDVVYRSESLLSSLNYIYLPTIMR